jgi:hypothetical protein
LHGGVEEEGGYGGEGLGFDSGVEGGGLGVLVLDLLLKYVIFLGGKV